VKTRNGWTLQTFFLPWLIISVIWFGVVGYKTWHDVPRDDWLSEPSTSQLSDAVNLVFYNPVARDVVVYSIVLAVVPPIVVLVCGWAVIWTVRESRRRRQ
jgi:ABC-type spermidine/putrescine transport system permease subunit I